MSSEKSNFLDRFAGRERARVESFIDSSDLAAFEDTTGTDSPARMPSEIHSDATAVHGKATVSVHDAAIIASCPLDGAEAKWIGLTSIKYRDPAGRERLWESAERKTKSAETPVDAVGIVAFLQYPPTHERGAHGKGPYIVLQKQFRPAVGKVCIEVPAGLVDAGESIETAALRELREETGYVGTIVKPSLGAIGDRTAFGISMTMYNDPGFCTTSTQMVHVEVDMSIAENASPKPELEDGEFIECFETRLSELWQECRRLEAQGYAIDARVGGLAEGIECAKWFGLR